MRLHYHLCVGQVAFYLGQIPENGEIDPSQVQHLVSNTALTTDSRLVRMKDIGQVQQALQMNVVRRLGPGVMPPKFLDVVITGMFYLGEMTKEEFEEGSVLQKAAAEAAQRPANQEEADTIVVSPGSPLVQ